MTPTLMPEEAVEPAHPLRVAPGEVVVDRDDVDAFAFERVQVGGQGGDERLAFAGLHLGDLAVVQHHAADELDVEVPHVEHAACRLRGRRRTPRQEVVERARRRRRACGIGGLAAELLVGERLDRRLERVDLCDERTQPLDFAFVLGADDLREELTDHSAGGQRTDE